MARARMSMGWTAAALALPLVACGQPPASPAPSANAPPPPAPSAQPSAALPAPAGAIASPQAIWDRREIAAGSSHACRLLKDGQVACWGDNIHGQVGDGSSTNRPIPQRVPGVAQAVAVAAGFQHGCALRADGRVLCWGGLPPALPGSGTRPATLSRSWRAGTTSASSRRIPGSAASRRAASTWAARPRRCQDPRRRSPR